MPAKYPEKKDSHGISEKKVLKSIGYLDGVILNDNFLSIVGWVGAEDAELTDFIVFAEGKTYKSDVLLIESGLDSPDIKKLYPSLKQSANARFKIKLPAELLMNRDELGLICCMPVFGEVFGKILFKFHSNKIAMPPSELVRSVGGGFLNVSFEFLDYFIRLAHIKPTERILDIGCGIGRMAYSLAGYLSPSGKYEGFDVADKFVNWGSENISNVYPNFRFRKIDLYNKWYNPAGLLKSESFTFPYENNSFDFVFLCSVFTHLVPQSVSHYLEEIYRVLDTNGRCLFTAFLMNEESKWLIQQGKSSLQIIHPYQDHFVKNVDFPEESIGYEESTLMETLKKNNFEVARIEYGRWPGRTKYLSYQDMVILIKK